MEVDSSEAFSQVMMDVVGHSERGVIGHGDQGIQHKDEGAGRG